MSVLELNVSRTASVTRTAQTLYSVNEMRLSGVFAFEHLTGAPRKASI